MARRHKFVKLASLGSNNSVAERKNRLVVEAEQAMLEKKSLPKFYWA